LLEDGVQISRMRIFEPSLALLEAEQILNFGLRCTPKPQRARAGFKAKLRRAVCSNEDRGCPPGTGECSGNLTAVRTAAIMHR
jgi:hypothetical protein